MSVSNERYYKIRQPIVLETNITVVHHSPLKFISIMLAIYLRWLWTDSGRVSNWQRMRSPQVSHLSPEIGERGRNSEFGYLWCAWDNSGLENETWKSCYIMEYYWHKSSAEQQKEIFLHAIHVEYVCPLTKMETDILKDGRFFCGTLPLDNCAAFDNSEVEFQLNCKLRYKLLF